MIIIYVILWLLSGSASFIWWNRKENFRDLDILSLALFFSLPGPFTFFLGWWIEHETNV